MEPRPCRVIHQVFVFVCSKFPLVSKGFILLNLLFLDQGALGIWPMSSVPKILWKVQLKVKSQRLSTRVWLFILVGNRKQLLFLYGSSSSSLAHRKKVVQRSWTQTTTVRNKQLLSSFTGTRRRNGTRAEASFSNVCVCKRTCVAERSWSLWLLASYIAAMVPSFFPSSFLLHWSSSFLVFLVGSLHGL